MKMKFAVIDFLNVTSNQDCFAYHTYIYHHNVLVRTLKTKEGVYVVNGSPTHRLLSSGVHM